MVRRRHLLSLVFLVATFALGFPQAGAAATGDCTPGADWPAANPGYAAQVLALVNEHRTELGLAPLATSGSLTGAAVWKARHMAAYTYMAHDDPAPPVARGVGARLAACGYSGSGWGENIAYGYPSPEQVVAGWLASSGHRANIENPSFKAIGIGAAATAGGVLYWAQDFGTSTGGSPPLPDPQPPEQSEDPPPAGSPPDEQPGDGPAPGGAGGGHEVVVQPESTGPGAPAEAPTDSPANDPAPEPSTEGPGAPGSELASLRVQAGKATTQNLGSLEADDARGLVIRSRAGRTAWRALFGLSDGALDEDTLELTFQGSSTLPCSQTISVWSPERQAWLPLDRRLLRKHETQVADAIDTADADASGNVLVRVLCQRTDGRAFATRTDLLTIDV